MANAHDAIDALINKNNVQKYDEGGKVEKKYTVKNAKFVYSKRKGDKHVSVVEVPTPTKDKPGDTRLYKGEAKYHSMSPSTGELLSQAKARFKSADAPADSLTRADYAKLKKVEEPPKKKKKKKFFKRNK